MTRKPFLPENGKIYRNAGGSEVVCIMALDGWKSCTAVMANIKSHWTFIAHGIGRYEDGTIDWDYSTKGYFVLMA